MARDKRDKKPCSVAFSDQNIKALADALGRTGEKWSQLIAKNNKEMSEKLTQELFGLDVFYWSRSNHVYFPAKIIEIKIDLGEPMDIEAFVQVLDTVRKVSLNDLCTDTEEDMEWAD